MKSLIMLAVCLVFCRFIETKGAMLDIGKIKNMVSRFLDEDQKDENVDLFRRDQQNLIDRREMSARGLSSCPKCPTPSPPPKGCEAGLKPIMVTKENCSCVASYQCCPSKCPELTRDDEDSCYHDNGKNYTGFQFPRRHRDCCGCDVFICIACPDYTDFVCENPCDERKPKYNPVTKCHEFFCVRKNAPPLLDLNCTKCQRVVTETDECGFHRNECKCKDFPLCRPPKPKELNCHSLRRSNMEGIFACGKNNACDQCYTWKYDLIPRENQDTKCLPCQEKVVHVGMCGNYTQTCQCRTPPDCQPVKPQPPKCHKAEKVLSSDTFTCSSNGNTCEKCWHWKFDLIKLETVVDVVCDKRCSYKRPIQKECGIEFDCVCYGKAKDECEPPEPEEQECHKPKKQYQEKSFMCMPEGENKCVNCYTWEWLKKSCDVQKSVKCKTKCERKVRRHLGCGCYKDICKPVKVPGCQPEKPAVDKCSKKKKVYLDTYTYDDVSKECRKCYIYKSTAVDLPEKNRCSLENLPKVCYSMWREKGDCGQLIKDCKRNSEVVKLTVDQCPDGLEVVTLTSTCGKRRDACIDCATDLGESRFPPKLPDHCYVRNTVKLLKKCDYPIFVKKECPMNELALGPCPTEGMKRKLFFTDCGCPQLKCNGCPTSKRLDFQMLLDSSGSIGKNDWIDLMDTLKVYCVDSMMTGDVRIAISKFGTKLEEIQGLSRDLKGEDLDGPKYEYRNMNLTYTGEALVKLFTSFNATARNEPGVSKVLLVITDGKDNGKVIVKDAAQKWKDSGVEIYALGYTGSNDKGLSEISANHYKNLDNLETLKREIQDSIVPEICGTVNTV